MGSCLLIRIVLLLGTVATTSQLIGLFSILLLLTFLKALSLKQLLMYLRQHATKGSALGTFKRWRVALLGSKGHQLRYLSSKNIRNVLVEPALYNRTHYFY